MDDNTKSNLLPINIQLFAIDDNKYNSTYTSSITSGGKGSFVSRVSVYKDSTCRGTRCFMTGVENMMTLNGISTSSSTFIPASSTLNINKQNTGQDQTMKPGSHEVLTYHSWYTFTDQEMAALNNLEPGTYFIWADGASRKSFVVTPSSFTVTSYGMTKQTAINNKLSQNPFVANLRWTNPTANNFYITYALTNNSSAAPGSIIFGLSGPHVLPPSASAGTTTYNEFSIEAAYNTNLLFQPGTNYYVSRFITDDPTAMSNVLYSGLTSAMTGLIRGTQRVYYNDLKLRFRNPEQTGFDHVYGRPLTISNIPGYATTKWVSDTSYALGQTIQGGVQFSTTEVFGPILNNRLTSGNEIIYLNGRLSNKATYTVNFDTSLPTGHTVSGSSYSKINTFQVNHNGSYTFAAHIPATMNSLATEYGEYLLNGFNYRVTNGTYVNPPFGPGNNRFVFQPNEYGNLRISANWEYQKYNLPGTLRINNSARSKTDFNGIARNFVGYTYKLYGSTTSTTEVNQFNFTATNGGEYLYPKAVINTLPGYEYVDTTLIDYPLESDGLVGPYPFNVAHFGSWTNVPNIHPDLASNSGTFDIYFEIPHTMSGNINVGVATKLKELKPRIKFGSEILSFNYNGKNYNSSHPNYTDHNGSRYYILDGVTFNVESNQISLPITNITTLPGYVRPNLNIDINGKLVGNNYNTLFNAVFKELPPATPIQYKINVSAGTGIDRAELDITEYNVLTPTFTPRFSPLNVKFGYDSPTISGSYTSNSGTVNGLTSLYHVVKPSYNNYDYLVTSNKSIYTITNGTIPLGINTFTIDKTTYTIESSAQEVKLSYTMNNGYELDTSKAVTVTGLTNVSGATVPLDATYNKFNIPPNTIGHLTVTPRAPKLISYQINKGDISNIRGINNFYLNDATYTIVHTGNAATVKADIGLKPGYKLSTENLVVTGGSGMNIVGKTPTQFTIGTNSWGDVTATPAPAGLNNYYITMGINNIDGYSVSGISSVTLDKSVFNVESETFRPAPTVSYVNSAFNGYRTNIININKGTYTNKDFFITGIPVEYGILINKDASINSFNFESSRYNKNISPTTYNVLISKTIEVKDVSVTNSLYVPYPNTVLGTIGVGSKGSKTYIISTPLKNNTITTNKPVGYSSITLSDNRYTATASSAKSVSINYVMNAGYAAPTASVSVTGLFNDTDKTVSATSLTSTGFTIPRNSWGNISVGIPQPRILEYAVNLQGGNLNNLPYQVQGPISVEPTGYNVTSGFPITFRVNANSKPGYNRPEIYVNGNSLGSGTTFSMPSFNTNVPNVMVYGGSPIVYNYHISIDNGIHSFTYKNNVYTDRNTVIDTFTVENVLTPHITNVVLKNALYLNYADTYAPSSANKLVSFGVALVSNFKRGTIKAVNALPEGVESLTFSIGNYVTSNIQNTPVTVNVVNKPGYYKPTGLTGLTLYGPNSETINLTSNGITGFNIPSNTWGSLVVNTTTPAKIDYTISKASLPQGVKNITITSDSNPINKYQISSLERTMGVVYEMNPGYNEPTGNLVVTGGETTVVDNKSFKIAPDSIGNITVSVDEPTKIEFDIKFTDNIPTGVESMTLSKNKYNVESFDQQVTITYNMKPGYQRPGSFIISGSDIYNITENSFVIRAGAVGSILVSPVNGTAKTYSVDIQANPKPAAIYEWSVSPSTYKVTDSYPKVFTVKCWGSPGYSEPTAYLNGVAMTTTTFTMESFSETAPKLTVTPRAVISYPITILWDTNPGIEQLQYAPLNYNVESQTFTPTITSITLKPGYESYIVTPPFETVEKGSRIGEIIHSVHGVPYIYNINVTKGVGINTASVDRTTYTIEDTGFTLNWTDVTYLPGYSGIASSSSNLTINKGTIGDINLNISANLLSYNITLVKPESSGIVSYKYNGVTYTASEAVVDTYTVVSPNKTIRITDIVYVPGYEGPTEVELMTIASGSTGHINLPLGSEGGINNIYIDIPDHTGNGKQKVRSFKYNGRTFEVYANTTRVLIDYYVEGFGEVKDIDITDIVDGYGFTHDPNYIVGQYKVDPNTDTGEKAFQLYPRTNKVILHLVPDYTIKSFKFPAENGGTPMSYDSASGIDKVSLTVDYDKIPSHGEDKWDYQLILTDVVYAPGYSGPDTIRFEIDWDNEDTSGQHFLVSTTEKETYTITVIKSNSDKVTSFVPEAKTITGITVTNMTYDIESPTIYINAKNIVYKTDNNTSGSWSLYVGPSSYGYNGENPKEYGYSGKFTKTGIDTEWKIESGSTGDKTFILPVDNIVSNNEFLINYNNKSATVNGYTSELRTIKNYYTYQTPVTINKNNDDSFEVVGNTILPVISNSLEQNKPIHLAYSLYGSSEGVTTTEGGNSVIIPAGQFGNKVVDINWTTVKHKLSIKDHYTIKDPYGLIIDPALTEKPSQISELTGSNTVYEVTYELSNEAKDYGITNNIFNKINIARTGWTFKNAGTMGQFGTVNIVGEVGNLSGFRIPAGAYGDLSSTLVYEPNVYNISLTSGDNSSTVDSRIKIVYDHEIEKFGPHHVAKKTPTSDTEFIFDGYVNSSGVEVIKSSGEYLFNNSTYTSNVVFTPKFKSRKDFLGYDDDKNIPIDSNVLEQVNQVTNNVTISYQRLKEEYLNPFLTQNLLPDSVIRPVDNSIPYTKFIFNLGSPNITARRVVDGNKPKGYIVLKVNSTELRSELNALVNTNTNIITNKSNFVTKLKSKWSLFPDANLPDIQVKTIEDMILVPQNQMETGMIASADIFRVMFAVGSSGNATDYQYYVFDGMCRTDDIESLKQGTVYKQNLFLVQGKDQQNNIWLKEAIKILDKNENPLYDRTTNVLDNNVMLTKWEDVLVGHDITTDVYGLLPVNLDKVYAMDMKLRSIWKSQKIEWPQSNTEYITQLMAYNSNVRVGQKQGETEIINYVRTPIRELYENRAGLFGNLTLNDMKGYTLNGDVLTVPNLDTKMGMGATEKGAISSDGQFFLSTMMYELRINNEKSASVKSLDMPNNEYRRYVYTPKDRNIGDAVVQGPVVDSNNRMRFYITGGENIQDAQIGILNPMCLNHLDTFIKLTRESSTSNWYYLDSPLTKIDPSRYYTVMIKVNNRWAYNNLLIYKMFKSA